MWVYVAVFAVVIVFLVGSYRALGRDTELSDQQINELTSLAASALSQSTDSIENGFGDLEAVRKTCAGWQLRLEPLRDIESSREVASLLIQGFSLLEWAVRLKLQGEKSEAPAFAQAATKLIEGVKSKSMSP